MNAFKIIRRGRVWPHRRAGQRATAFLLMLTLVSSAFMIEAVSSAPQTRVGQRSDARRLSEEQRILHILNRLGFGARPGDVERVRALGVERYIEQQLQPEMIEDAVAEAKVRRLPTLSMSSAELLARYPNPGILVRRLQRRGELPADLAALREDRRPDGSAAPLPGAAPDRSSAPVEDSATAGGAMPPPGEAEKDGERAKYRRAIRDYMAQNNLALPQRIIAELQASRILRAVYSERQLQEVMVDFWTNHFNVFAGKGADRWLLTSYDRDTIRPHTLGKFRNLLGATAQSPAMLFYLDNFQSVSPNARGVGDMNRQRRRALLEMRGATRQRMDRRAAAVGVMSPPQGQGTAPLPPQQQQQRPRRGINENYARELMELHTLGVDGGYTQKDVQEIARAFTGWTIRDPRGIVAGESAATFHFNPRLHDDGEKVVLGQKIPAGGGMKDGEMVLDILARHPSTARFIATKLCRRFVIDNPPSALVERVAAAFTRSDGDMRATLRAIFTAPEFTAPEMYRAKIKTPFELTVSAIRALGGETDARPALHQWVAKMGEPLYLYQAPTGYPDTAESWVNTGALLERLNFALALVSNRIPGTRVDLERFVGEAANSSRQVEQRRIVEQFLNSILRGEVSPRTKETLLRQLSAQDTAPIAAPTEMEAAGERDRPHDNGEAGARRGKRAVESASIGNPDVARIAALILGSPEFQRQ